MGLFGCTGDQLCVDVGHCTQLPSNVGYHGFWVLTIILGIVVVGCLILAVAALSDSEGGAAAFLAFVAVLAGGGAYWAYPGKASPREKAEVEFREKVAVELKEQETKIAKKRTEAAPQAQLDKAKATRSELQRNLDMEVRPLRVKYQREYGGYVEQLKLMIPKSRLRTHKDLLENRDSNIDLINILNRTATLEHALAWLDKKISNGDRAIKTLDQNAWRLEKLIEMNQIASQEESDSVRRIVANAEALLDEKTVPEAKQDVAAIEAKLFEKYATTGAQQ